MGLQRQFDRLALKNLDENEEKPKGWLEKHNDKIGEYNEDYTRVLHATKGYRTISMKRARATYLTAEIKRGMFPPIIVALQAARKFILTGMYK